MADTKISALSSLTTPTAAMLLPVVDVSDATMAASGTDKQITAAQFHSPARYASYNNSSPADGDVWYGSTQKTLAGYTNGITHRYTGCLYSQGAAGSSVGGSTLTSLTNDTGAIGTRTLPANFLVTGKSIRVCAGGYFTPGGINVDVRFQVLLGGVVLGDTNNSPVAAGSQANFTAREWNLDFVMTYQGSSACVGAGNLFRCGTGPNTYVLPIGTTTTAATVTASGTLAVDVKSAWNSSNAGQVCVMNYMTIESLN